MVRSVFNRVGVLERVSDDAQVCAASAAELAELAFFRTAGRAVHVGGLYGKSVWKFLPSLECGASLECGRRAPL